MADRENKTKPQTACYKQHLFQEMVNHYLKHILNMTVNLVGYTRLDCGIQIVQGKKIRLVCVPSGL